MHKRPRRKPKPSTTSLAALAACQTKKPQHARARGARCMVGSAHEHRWIFRVFQGWQDFDLSMPPCARTPHIPQLSPFRTPKADCARSEHIAADPCVLGPRKKAYSNSAVHCRVINENFPDPQAINFRASTGTLHESWKQRSRLRATWIGDPLGTKHHETQKPSTPRALRVPALKGPTVPSLCPSGSAALSARTARPELLSSATRLQTFSFRREQHPKPRSKLSRSRRNNCSWAADDGHISRAQKLLGMTGTGCRSQILRCWQPGFRKAWAAVCQCRC